MDDLLRRATELNAAAAARIQAYLLHGGRIPPALVRLWESSAAEIRQTARTQAELEGMDPGGVLARVLDEIAAEMGAEEAGAGHRPPAGRTTAGEIEIVVQGVLM
jgi:hypothetical protein